MKLFFYEELNHLFIFALSMFHNLEWDWLFIIFFYIELVCLIIHWCDNLLTFRLSGKCEDLKARLLEQSNNRINKCLVFFSSRKVSNFFCWDLAIIYHIVTLIFLLRVFPGEKHVKNYGQTKREILIVIWERHWKMMFIKVPGSQTCLFPFRILRGDSKLIFLFLVLCFFGNLLSFWIRKGEWNRYFYKLLFHVCMNGKVIGSCFVTLITGSFFFAGNFVGPVC